jgi:hypothetical protein
MASVKGPEVYFDPDELPETFYHGQILKFILHVTNPKYHSAFESIDFIYSVVTTRNDVDVTFQNKWEMVRCIKQPAPADVTLNDTMTIEVYVQAVSPWVGNWGCLLAPLNLLPEAFVSALLRALRPLGELFRIRGPIKIGSGQGGGVGSDDDTQTRLAAVEGRAAEELMADGGTHTNRGFSNIPIWNSQSIAPFPTTFQISEVGEDGPAPPVA